jgi:5'(3')-deoxyribonucleotidase
MKRIAIDMDEVIADVIPRFLDLYEQEFGIRLQPEQYLGKKIYQLNGANHIRKFLFDKGFFADLPVIPDSQEVIQELMERYEVFITTAAMEFRASLEDKYDWLQQHFPFIHWKNFVFCGDKSVIRADYMIDDHAFNLRTFNGKGLLYTAAHNIHETAFIRVNNWQEVRTFFQQEYHRNDKI